MVAQMTRDEDKTEGVDIIIVGAGTAGCVLANRLSEDRKVSVTVLEAGDDRIDDEQVYTPGLAEKLLGNPEFDWQYVSEPQPCLDGRQMKHPRGKVVGGSSAINSFALIYPSAAGMDIWAELGNKGWAWSEMKPYFRKFQTVCPPDQGVKRQLNVCESKHKTSGPLQASYPRTILPFQRAWVETFRALGLENTSDPLDGTALGGYLSTNHITNDQHERSYAGSAYLRPILTRPNLNLITRATVQRIIFDGLKNGNAIGAGVVYLKDGVHRKLGARKEVILAAGVFASPQLLELSGVGDSTRLRKLGIESVYHNPSVGENLQDHIRCGLSFEAAEDIDLHQSLSPAQARKLYEKSREGPWAERACYTFAYVPLSPFLTSAERKQLSESLNEHPSEPSTAFEQKRNEFIKRMILSPCEATATAFLSRRPPAPDVELEKWFTLNAMLSHPFSSGSSHIVSPNGDAKPKVDFGYYTDPMDVEIHARHLVVLSHIATTSPLFACIDRNGKRFPPDAQELSLERAREVLRDYATTNYHPCGTCSMMPEGSGGVISDKLRVYGTANVRVVDASMIPIIPRGNIVTTVYAVAEKAADIVSQSLNIERDT